MPLSPRLRFHTCQIEAKRCQVKRKAWTVVDDPMAVRVASQFDPLAKVSHSFPPIPFFEAGCLRPPVQGAGLYYLETADLVYGASLLVLCGMDADTEADCCREFQQRFRHPYWRMPLPPMEVAVRPLFFTVTFYMQPTRRRYARYAKTAISCVNAIGLSLLMQQRLGKA